MKEIERKFLVTSMDFMEESTKYYNIRQGYLNSDSNRNIRIRILDEDEDAFITIKGPSNISGMTRYEWQERLPYQIGNELIELSEGAIIEKTRYKIPYGRHIFEVDVFLGKHTGLVLAEIELRSEDENFIKPLWLGDEVTGNLKYYNDYLSKL